MRDTNDLTVLWVMTGVAGMLVIATAAVTQTPGLGWVGGALCVVAMVVAVRS